MQFQRKIGPEQHTVLAKIIRCGIALILMAAFVFALLLCAQPVGKLLLPPVKYYSNETDVIEYGGGDIFVSVDKIRSFDVYADVTNNSDTAIMLRGSMVQKMWMANGCPSESRLTCPPMMPPVVMGAVR